MILLVPLLALCAAVADAQNRPQPQGWGPVTWGMTVAEAHAALGPAAVPATDRPGPNIVVVDRLLVPGIAIGGLTARAAIQTARESDRISAVTLDLAGLDASPRRRAEAFDQVKQLLMQKYGRPKDENSRRTPEGDTEHTVVWNFPATSITLTWQETTPRYALGFVTLRYQAVDRKALDIL